MKIKILFFLLLICLNPTTRAQDKWTHLSKEDGLPSTWVRDCAEDKQGNLWFTTDKGLCKYDGNNLESFTKQDGLPLKTLMKIFIDKNEVVWFTIEPANNFSKAVGPVLEALTKRGNGWGRYDGNEIIANMNKSSSEYLWSHVENIEGEIWIGGVNRENKKGAFWVNYDGKAINPLTQLGGKDLSSVNHFFCNGKDDIWFSSGANNGDFIYHFDGTNLSAYGEKDGLPSKNMYQYIHIIFKDSKDNLWFGASLEGKLGGLMRFDGSNWTTYTKENGFDGKSINQIVEDGKSNIWISTEKALNVFNGKSWKNYSAKDKLPSKFITKLLADSKGRVWIGTMEGLLLFDNGQWSTIDKKNGLSHSAVREIFEDSKGNIWVGAAPYGKKGGISVFDGNNWNSFDFQDIYTSKFFEDSKGNIWVLSIGNGIFKYEL